MATKTEAEQSRELIGATLLPTQLGKKIAKDIWGIRFKNARHLRYIEQHIVPALMDDEQRFIMVNTPPRHGKTMFVLLCAAWFLMMYPTKRVIYISYNDDLAGLGGQQVRTIIERYGPRLFDVRVSKVASGKGDWQMEDSPLSGMLSAGVGSTINGRGGDLIIVDDLIKNAEEAASIATKAKHVREWDGTIRSRLEPGGTIIVIATRWAEDDLPGTIRDRCAAEGYDGDPWEFLELPALAEPTEDDLEDIYKMYEADEAERQLAAWRDELGRREGEALWPERFDAKNLQRIRASIDLFTWSALYQQRPTTAEGGMFPKGAWRYYDPKDPPEVGQRVWVWDTAFSGEGGDWTVGGLFGRTLDGKMAVLKLLRFKGQSSEVEKAICGAAYTTGPSVPVYIEQEKPGSGKYVVQSFQKLLAGWDVEGVKPDGSKTERAGPYSSGVQLEMVLLPEGAPWIKAWHHEHRVFPRGKNDDQVDIGAYAWNKLMTLGDVVAFSPVGLALDGEREMVRFLEQAGIAFRRTEIWPG